MSTLLSLPGLFAAPCVRMAALSLALCGLAPMAQAAGPLVPVEVTVYGLPSGLSPEVRPTRFVCSEGMALLANRPQRMAEKTTTVWDRVVSPLGVASLQPREVTRYVASFVTPAGPQPGDLPQGLPVSCGAPELGGLGQEELSFAVAVPGQRHGQDEALVGGLGIHTVQGTLRLQMAAVASITQLAVTSVADNALPRGMFHRVKLSVQAPMGRVVQPALTLSRTVAGRVQTVARLFERADGRSCVQAAQVTRCVGDQAGPLLHGGLRLLGVGGQDGERQFVFELLQDFPLGALRLTASAQVDEPGQYRVDGVLTRLTLMPVQDRSLDTVVQ